MVLGLKSVELFMNTVRDYASFLNYLTALGISGDFVILNMFLNKEHMKIYKILIWLLLILSILFFGLSFYDINNLFHSIFSTTLNLIDRDVNDINLLSGLKDEINCIFYKLCAGASFLFITSLFVAKGKISNEQK